MKAIIIDDEPHCRNVIERILEKHCPEITIAATANDGIEGLKAIICRCYDGNYGAMFF